MIPIELAPLIFETDIGFWVQERDRGYRQQRRWYSLEEKPCLVWRPKQVHEAWTEHLRARAEEDRTRGD